MYSFYIRIENYDSQIDSILYYTKDIKNYTFNEIKETEILYYPLFENGLSETKSFPFIYKNIEFNPGKYNKHWLTTEDKIKELIDKNEFILKDEMPYRKTNVIPIGNI